ncbi:hypothetical protein CYY_001321 [Polysphondylium violaceum]|uniref:Uncharacterized protein n=1 Tax=Polysphondylium violaceum TaxID=133409 RepID=A0A8J4Q023_9MYCE|nr:hypothetical protein CYY_001321 [Polysphondylium violaceum]
MSTVYIPLKQINDTTQPTHQDNLNIHHFILKSFMFYKKKNPFSNIILNFKKKAIHTFYYISNDEHKTVFKIEKLSTSGSLTGEEEEKLKNCLTKDISTLTAEEQSLDKIIEAIKVKGDYIIHYTDKANIKEDQGNESFLLIENLDHTKVSLSNIVKTKKEERDFEFTIEQEEAGYPHDLILRVRVTFKNKPKFFELKIIEGEYYLGYTKQLEKPTQEVEEFMVKLVVKNSDFTNPTDSIQVKIISDEFKDSFFFNLHTEYRFNDIIDSFGDCKAVLSIHGGPRTGKSTLGNNIINFMISENKTHLHVGGNMDASVTTEGEYVSCNKLAEIKKSTESFPYADLLLKMFLTVLDNPPITKSNTTANDGNFEKTREIIEANITLQIDGKYPNKKEIVFEANNENKVDVFIFLFPVQDFISCQDKVDFIRLFTIGIEVVTLKHKSFPIVALTQYENVNPQIMNQALSAIAFPVLKSNIFKIPKNPSKDTLFRLIRKVFEIKRAKTGKIISA